MSMKQHHRACTFGRFNLLHKGHVLLFEKMHSLADYLTIGLSTKENNLPFELRKEVIDIALTDSGIPYTVVEAPHPFALFDRVKWKGNPDVVTVFGVDQFRLGRVAEQHYGWPSDTVDRLTSSTALRVALDKEDWDLVATLTMPDTVSHLVNLRQLELGNH